MSSLSLARRAGAGFERDFQEPVGVAGTAFPPVSPPPPPPFSRHRRIRLLASGIAALAVLAVGAGHVALNQIPTSVPPRRQRMLGEQRGDDPDRIFTDRRSDRGGRGGRSSGRGA